MVLKFDNRNICKNKNEHHCIITFGINTNVIEYLLYVNQKVKNNNHN